MIVRTACTEMRWTHSEGTLTGIREKQRVCSKEKMEQRMENTERGMTINTFALINLLSQVSTCETSKIFEE